MAVNLLPSPLLTRKNVEVAGASSTDISADDAMKCPEFYMVAAFYALITFNQQISVLP